MEIIEAIRSLDLVYKLGIFCLIVGSIIWFTTPWLLDKLDYFSVTVKLTLDNVLGLTFAGCGIIVVIALLRALVEIVFDV